MSKPLSARTLFSSGKVEELVSLAKSVQAEILLVHNSLTKAQREVLEELTQCRVVSFQDDMAPHLDLA